MVVSEDGPLMAPWVNRAALQKSIGRIFYHAGFEDFQPSAMDSVTDVTIEFMRKIGQTLKHYHERPTETEAVPVYTHEEELLHVLDENGMDIESLESYIRDDVERQTTKLTTMHERMKSHLADLLVSYYFCPCNLRISTDMLEATCFGRSRWRRRCWGVQRRKRTIRRWRLRGRLGRGLLRLPRAGSR